MNVFDLVTQDELDDLPEHPRQAFAQFARHAYRRLNEKIETCDLNESYGWQEANQARAGYMNVLIAAARRFEIKPFAELEVPKIAEVGENEYNQFKADIDHFLTQIALDSTFQKRNDSVLIGENAKQKIRSYLHQIKLSIDEADFDENKKSQLLQKIADFEKALDRRRLPLITITYLTLAVAALPGGVISSYDGLTRITSKILNVIYEEKIIEDQQRLPPYEDSSPHLYPPRPQLTYTSKQQIADASNSDDLDDDVPF